MNTHSLTHPQPHGLSSLNSCQIFDLLDFYCFIPALNGTDTQNWRLFYWCVFSQWLLFVINCEPLAVSQLQSFIRSTNGEKGEEKQHTTTCQLPWSFFCSKFYCAKQHRNVNRKIGEYGSIGYIVAYLFIIQFTAKKREIKSITRRPN